MRPDGTGLSKIIATYSFKDTVTLSPDVAGYGSGTRYHDVTVDRPLKHDRGCISLSIARQGTLVRSTITTRKAKRNEELSWARSS